MFTEIYIDTSIGIQKLYAKPGSEEIKSSTCSQISVECKLTESTRFIFTLHSFFPPHCYEDTLLWRC